MSKYKHDITSVALETGLSKETIRKWESRYGFPEPRRDENKERLYSTKQVNSLREASRLIHAGLRPKYAVLAVSENQRRETKLKRELSPFSQQVVQALAANDRDKVYFLLQRDLITHGVISFLENSLSELNESIGEAWAHGLIKIYQEHLYSDVILGILKKEMLDLPTLGNAPIQVLLATPPGEIHTIGIQMVELWLKFHGIRSISFGAQVPISELIAAEIDIKPNAIGISMSNAFALRHARKYVLDLSAAIPEKTQIWLGGAGVPVKETFPENVMCCKNLSTLTTVLETLNT